MNSLTFKKQDFLEGSSKIYSHDKKKITRSEHYLQNVTYTKSFYYKSLHSKDKRREVIINELIDDFNNYRKNWNDLPNKIININKNKKLTTIDFAPLCVDLEAASICDLACPHCFREYIATPDKIIDLKFAKEIIDQVSDLKIPSMKFNWRGEPLLNPKLPELIDYAKSKGIIDTIINSNATNLTSNVAEDLIKSGLDHLIYSFDGGTKKTYEKYRPGRFTNNTFEKVYSNIENFHYIKNKLKAHFPFTKIQMILMDQTRNEIEDFYKNFSSIVDEVTVTQYSERGGKISNLEKDKIDIIKSYFKKNNLPDDTPFMIQADGSIFISLKRKPCDQIFQRLMITYEGKVGMCCIDWGATHNLGFLSKKGFDHQKEEGKILEKIKKNQKGYELLKFAKMSKIHNDPPKKVSKLKEIWEGENLNKVRNLHLSNKGHKVSICKDCQYKENI